MFPRLIKRDEVVELIKLVNISSPGLNPNTLIELDYQQFLLLIPQLCLFMFSRPPRDFSSYPPITSMQGFIDMSE